MDSLLNIFSFRISQCQCLMGLGLKVLISLWFPLLSDWFLCGNPPLCAWQGIASAEFSIALLAYWPFCPPCLHMYWTTHSLLDSRLPFAACFSGTIGTNSWISRQVKETCQKPVKSAVVLPIRRTPKFYQKSKQNKNLGISPDFQAKSNESSGYRG